MSIFKTNAPEKQVDDTKEVVHDFTRRAPFWSYRTVAYREYAPLVNLKDELDCYLDALFRGDIDDGNGDVLDNLIFDAVRRAWEDLKKQRVDHLDTITSFGIRAQSDRTAFEEQLTQLEESLSKNIQEQEFIRDLLNRCEYQEGYTNA